MRVGSLFSGIGGFDLAARWMGWDTVFFAESDPYASRVLAQRFPGVHNYGDVREFTGGRARCDVLTGGFPCQDISVIGKGAGITGSRSGLWKQYARIIGEIAPRYVVIENSPALRGRGLDTVLRDLHALGYDAEWHCIPAAYVGAPHRRDRIWIVAYPIGAGLEGHAGDGEVEGDAQPYGPIGTACLRGREDAARWWALEPDVGRVGHGIPARVDRLRCLGNAIVPQVAYRLFQAIGEVDEVVKSCHINPHTLAP